MFDFVVLDLDYQLLLVIAICFQVGTLQGVRVMNVDEGDHVASVGRVD